MRGVDGIIFSISTPLIEKNARLRVQNKGYAKKSGTRYDI